MKKLLFFLFLIVPAPVFAAGTTHYYTVSDIIAGHGSPGQRYFVYDAESDKPGTGLTAGDRAYVKASSSVYIALNNNTWSLDYSSNNLASSYYDLIVSTGLFLSKSSATLTYPQNSSMTVTYLEKSSATATYLQNSSATVTYLEKSSATTTYLKFSSATVTYLEKSSAPVTYLQLSSAPVSYVAKNTSLVAGGYLPAIAAGVTFYAFTPDCAITLKRVTACITVAGTGGGGDTWRVGSTGVNMLSVVTSAAAGAGTNATATGSINIASGTKVNMWLNGTSNPRPAGNLAVQYQPQ